ncbi:MAG: hypothetical protein PF440_07355 [Thiomicrorhabdus sp.]|jgi:hypothetical protein|nr:hypothetical protein [Thiomicrorhabdus sp.]
MGYKLDANSIGEGIYTVTKVGSIIGAFIETSWFNSKTLLEIKSEALIYLQEEIWPMKWQDWDIDEADFRYHQQKEES